MRFGERLAQLRRECGKSQPELEEASGVPLPTIRGHEQSRREPTLGHLYAYCKALGVSCDAFKDCVYRTAPKPTARKKK